MAMTITSLKSPEDSWLLEEMSETIEFRDNPDDPSDSPKREYRHHATIVISRIYRDVYGIEFDGSRVEALGGTLTLSETDVDVCTGTRDADSGLFWNQITGVLGGVYDSDSYAKITLISDSIYPEANYSTLARRVQEWDAVSDWKEYTGDA